MPPGGNGTTIRVMLPAPVWARADCANGAVMAPSTSERREIVVIAFPLEAATFGCVVFTSTFYRIFGHTTRFRAATSRKNDALSFGVRF